MRSLSLLALSIAFAVGPTVAGAQSPAASDSSEQVVRAFIAAYNRHAVADLLALADSGIAWLSVEGDSVRLETRGRAGSVVTGDGVEQAARRAAHEYAETIRALGLDSEEGLDLVRRALD